MTCARILHHTGMLSNIRPLVRMHTLTSRSPHIAHPVWRSRKGLKQKVTIVMFAMLLAMWTTCAAYWLITVVMVFDMFQSVSSATSGVVSWIALVKECNSAASAGTMASSVLQCFLEPVPAISTEHYVYVQLVRDCTGTVALACNVSCHISRHSLSIS